MSTPSWLQDEEDRSVDLKKSKITSDRNSIASKKAASQHDSAEAPLSASDTNAVAPPCKSFVKSLFLIVDLGLAVLMASVGVLGIMNAEASGEADDSNTIFLGLYMIIFASVLFFYEICAICPIKSLDNFLRNNVGFMYSVFGRGFYMIFIAVICFSITDPQDMAYGTGAALAAIGLLQMILYLQVPAYFGDEGTTEEVAGLNNQV